jgi:hypothetical protein
MRWLLMPSYVEDPIGLCSRLRGDCFTSSSATMQRRQADNVHCVPVASALNNENAASDGGFEGPQNSMERRLARAQPAFPVSRLERLL